MRRAPFNPIPHRRPLRAAFTIIESVVAMAIVAMMLVAAIHAAGAAARFRGIQRDHEIGLMLAQDLLAEIVQAHYREPVDEPIFGRESGEATTDRMNWDDVDDYDGLVELPPRTKANEIMESFAAWQREVVITPANPAGNAPLAEGASDQGVRLIEVSVISPAGAVSTLGAMRADIDALRQQPTLDSVFVSRVGVTLRMAPESVATVVGAANVLINVRRRRMKGVDREPIHDQCVGHLADCSATRRGSVYILILVVSAIVFTVGIGAVRVQGIRARAAKLTGDAAQARALAQAAVEQGLLFVNESSAADVNWRQTIIDSDMDVSPEMPLHGGTIRWSIVKPNGTPMSDDPEKPLHVVGVGARGHAEHALRAVIRPSGPAYNALAVGLFAHDGMIFGAGSVLQSDRTIASNGDIEATVASVFPNVESATQIVGGTFFGIAVPFASPRGLPGKDHVLDYYEANGTIIDAALLPSTGGARVLQDIVLGPSSNPFGPLNPEGIYVVDCGGESLVIRNCRILGTIVVDGQAPGEVTTLTGEIHMQPASENFPCLMTARDLHFDVSGQDLGECVSGANFNPPGTPYEGESDESADDTYPSLVRGMFYSKNDIRFFGGHSQVNGIVIAHDMLTVDAGGIVDVTYRPEIAEDPPPGFFVPDGNVRIAAFSWAQVEP